MDECESQGIWIAATCQLSKKGDVWLVPSQSDIGFHAVMPDGKDSFCTCDYHAKRRGKCKHIWAAEITERREQGKPPISFGKPIPKPVKTQVARTWRNYNRAKASEGRHFQKFLRALCDTVPDPPRKEGPGRPPLSLSDAIFAMCSKVYIGHGGRKATEGMEVAVLRGHLERVHHYNSTEKYLRQPSLTPILTDLITRSSLPFTEIETVFAVDSSGFGSSKFRRWSQEKPGTRKRNRSTGKNRPRRQIQEWMKAHIMVGVKTNVVTAVTVTDWIGKGTGDPKWLPHLLEVTRKNFDVKEVLADKGYLSRTNYNVIDKAGAKGFIPFRVNQSKPTGNDPWAKAYHEFSLHPEKFDEHYHKRSNVESTFHMIKSQFRDHIRAKHVVGMTNEVLCKVLCHNICCVIMEMYELDIDPSFGSDVADADLVAERTVAHASFKPRSSSDWEILLDESSLQDIDNRTTP